ncbi:MAG: acetate--CoA ligase family protein [Deltaproteobacteria bacterium]|nr:acetate--CoA ligase family protein [Deltaproteobacteria bacterium]
MKTTDAIKLINRVKAEGRLSMTEAESKKLLSDYGVPVVEDKVVDHWTDAVSYAREIGFPVVVKGHGSKLTHKTERDLVKTNLKSAEEVQEAFCAVKKAAGEDWEGCLISPFVKGSREFVAGLFRDSQFGPVVMFGLGGVYTEALSDVTFRVAPLTEKHGLAMIDEIKAGKLLGAFRGEAPADREQLLRVISGLSRLGLEHPEIQEVDINPLIIMPDGSVKAVDALVVLDGGKTMPVTGKASESNLRKRSAEIRAAIDVMAHARSVAVVGASGPNESGFAGMFGCIKNFGYQGRLYPINPKFDEINGLKAYPNLSSLPEAVDLVIVSIRGPLVPGILKECVATGNKNIHIFSSGFKETGEEEGIRLQQEIETIAREGGLHVIGPNCMGFYVPKTRLLTWEDASKESGPVSLISQSGGNAQDFTNYTTDHYGIHFSKVISYGNALTLDSTDFLDYLGRDKETRIITMYLEGVKNGRLLLNRVTEINRRKPVIIYKSGLSESGARAVSSHTGSLAGGEKIWKAFFRQTGAAQAESLEEMADITQAFHRLGKVRGRRTSVLGFGGGIGVSAADNCAKANLELPAFSESLTRKLRTLIPPAGAMIRNPIDAVVAFINLPLMGEVLHLVAQSGEIDNFVISVPFDWLFNKAPGGAYIETVAQYVAHEAQKHTLGKPIMVAWRQYQPSEEIRRWIPVFENILMSAGIAVYEGLPAAVSALAKVAEYYEYQRDNKQRRIPHRLSMKRGTEDVQTVGARFCRSASGPAGEGLG